MALNSFYLNLIKFLTMAFVLGFTAYVANANDVIPDLGSFSVGSSCITENPDCNSSNKITNYFLSRKN